MRRPWTKFLGWMMRRQVVIISNKYPDITREELIRWCDFMAIELATRDGGKPIGKKSDRMLGIMISLARELEK